MSPLSIEIWSDIACPWCYIGKRRLEKALASPEVRRDVGPVAVRWRAFELNPAAPRSYPAKPPYVERLARKYGVSVSQFEQLQARVARLGALEGIEFRFEQVKDGNSFDGHRLLALAARHGMQDSMKERLMRAHFSEGVPIGEPVELLRLAREVGLDESEVQALLESDLHADDVRHDEQSAAELGIHGVPFFKIGRYGVSGAQPTELLVEVLGKAHTESLTAEAPASARAPQCDPDGICE